MNSLIGSKNFLMNVVNYEWIVTNSCQMQNLLWIHEVRNPKLDVIWTWRALWTIAITQNKCDLRLLARFSVIYSSYDPLFFRSPPLSLLSFPLFFPFVFFSSTCSVSSPFPTRIISANATLTFRRVLQRYFLSGKWNRLAWWRVLIFPVCWKRKELGELYNH